MSEKFVDLNSKVWEFKKISLKGEKLKKAILKFSCGIKIKGEIKTQGNILIFAQKHRYFKVYEGSQIKAVLKF